MFPTLTEDEIAQVIAAVRSYSKPAAMTATAASGVAGAP
jgi:uncharacterized protein (UPF0548 family)